MSDTKTLQSIADDAKDIFKTQIEWGNVDPSLVPNDDDKTLSFETNQVKRGKKFTTAVLFVDLRNSTTLNFEHNPEQLGKLYAAFVRSMIQCAEQYRGVIRNIIGDRVMVVFPEKDCCTNAVNTAITMNTVVTKILNPLFKGAEVKAGIGIDYGTMYVEKVGMPREGKERDAYKNLVWLGRPANVAAKLTDAAGKGTSWNPDPNILLTSAVNQQLYQEQYSNRPSLNLKTIYQAILPNHLSAGIFGTSFCWHDAAAIKL